MRSKKSVGDRITDTIIYVLLSIMGFIFLYPVLKQIAISFSSSYAVAAHEVILWPVDFTLKSYEQVFKTNVVMRAYGNTIYYTVLGTFINLAATTMLAYPLSKPRLYARGKIAFFFYFTNLFGAGMIPTYLVVKSVGLMDTVWALVLPGCTSVFYAIVLRTNFESIPSDLEDAARIDGLGTIGTLTKIYIPLSKATYAALTLFFAISYWNSYMAPLLYLNDSTRYTLQQVLRDILLRGSLTDLGVHGNAAGAKDVLANPDTLKAACIMVVMLPIMCVYPFIQKYFVKGVMIGAVKG